jgi:ribosomal protein S18 acetylase RimI-like enzyme
VLVEKFIERIKRRKYNYIVAHVKVGKSLSLFKKFNATIEKEFKNYEKTGKRYDLIVIDLKKKYFDADPKLLVKRKL